MVEIEARYRKVIKVFNMMVMVVDQRLIPYSTFLECQSHHHHKGLFVLNTRITSLKIILLYLQLEENIYLLIEIWIRLVLVLEINVRSALICQNQKIYLQG